ncbi:MAG: hypothetical protein RJA03_465 [Pseudomonadota bacterium]|jgi:hypothetical protein
MTNLDRTFCASPGCKNECGRKMMPSDVLRIPVVDKLISYAYFCDQPKNLDRFTNICLKPYGEKNDKA